MLYDNPKYYEVMFSFRDLTTETDFMQICMERFSRIAVRDVLEVACGPAPHAGELIKRGYNYFGLDINNKMLSYAHQQWQDLRPSPELIQADMVSFDLDRKTDFVFVMIGSLYLQSEQDLASHFDSVARTLRSGGLYFMDWCLQFFDPASWDDSLVYNAEKDGIKMNSRFHIEPLPTGRNMFKETWTIDIDDHGEHHRLEMVERNLALFPADFLRFLKSRDDFEFVGWWSEWNLERPIERADDVYRPLVIIRRK